MPEASVRRDGTGNPDPRRGLRQLADWIRIPPLRALCQLAGGMESRRYVRLRQLADGIRIPPLRGGRVGKTEP